MASRQHKSMSLQKAVLTVLTAASTDWMIKHGAPAPPPKLSAEQRQVIKDAFDMLDADGSGEVGVEELMEAYALIDMPMTRAQAQTMMDEVDADGSGQMEFEEFKALMVKAMNKPTEVGTVDTGSVPISDMALAFRRKKMLDATINGGEGRDKLARMYEPPSKPPKLFPKLPGAAGKHAAASRIACVANAMLTLSRQSSPEAQQLLQMLGSLSRSGSLTPSPAGSKRGSLDIAAGHGPRSPGGHTPSRQSLEAATARAFSSGGYGSLPHLTSSTHAPSPGDTHPNFGLNPALSPTFVRVPDGGWRAADGSSHAIGTRSSTGGLGAAGGVGSGDGSGCSSPKAYGVHSSLLAIASAKAARALMDGRASGSGGAGGMLLQVPHSSSGISSPSGAYSPHAPASMLLSAGRFSSPGSPASGSPMALNPASFNHLGMNPGGCQSPGGHPSRPALTATLQLCKSMRSLCTHDGDDADTIEEEDEEEDSDEEDGGMRQQPVLHGMPNQQCTTSQQHKGANSGQAPQPGIRPALQGQAMKASNTSSGSAASFSNAAGSNASTSCYNSSSSGASKNNPLSMNAHDTNASCGANNLSSTSKLPATSSSNGTIHMALHSSLYSSSSANGTQHIPQSSPPTFIAIKADGVSRPVKRTSSVDAPARNSLSAANGGAAAPAAAAAPARIPGFGNGARIPANGRRSRDVARDGAALPNVGPFSEAMCK